MSEEHVFRVGVVKACHTYVLSSCVVGPEAVGAALFGAEGPRVPQRSPRQCLAGALLWCCCSCTSGSVAGAAIAACAVVQLWLLVIAHTTNGSTEQPGG